MIQSVWKNLTGLQKAAEHLWCDLIDLEPKHQWLVHSLYGQKYWDTPFFRREKGTYKQWLVFLEYHYMLKH